MPRLLAPAAGTALSALSVLSVLVALLAGAVPGAAAPVGSTSAARVVVAAAAPAGPAAAPVHTRQAAPPTLRYGMRGPAVAVVQRELAVTPVSGWFGPRTLAAVRAFQARNGITVTGVVGPRTWAALGDRPSREAARLQPPVPEQAVPAAAGAPAAPAPAPAPVDGRACPTRDFTWGDGFGASRWHGRHQGVDLMGARGTPIFAVESGFVLREGRQSNGALRIVLQGRSGSKYYYGHMDRDLVRAGDRVDVGEVIGLMGDSGAPGAVHLHFEYWKSGGESDAVDPEPLLRSIC